MPERGSSGPSDPEDDPTDDESQEKLSPEEYDRRKTQRTEQYVESLSESADSPSTFPVESERIPGTIEEPDEIETTRKIAHAQSPSVTLRISPKIIPAYSVSLILLIILTAIILLSILFIPRLVTEIPDNFIIVGIGLYLVLLAIHTYVGYRVATTLSEISVIMNEHDE